ncbi:MAG: TetR/AcrR family transcriptional regulator [Acidimicrobiales bacterium]
MSSNARGRATRERLLDAAEVTFVEQGWSLSMEQVASAAGVVRPTVYRHFDGRDDLLVAMVLRSAARLGDRLDEVLGADRPWPERLVESVVTVVTEMRATPHLAALVRSGEVTSAWPEIDADRRFVEGVLDFFRSWLERAASEGVRFRAPIDDVVDWLLRTTVMQLTVPGLGGIGVERLRYELETFLLPAIVEA